MKTNLSLYNNNWYNPGHPVKRFLWYYVSIIFFQNNLFPFISLKRWLLKSFGAKIGKGVILKPNILIKHPWKLSVGDYVWIGEKAWIDNLAEVVIGNNVCISQEAYLLTGNHNFKLPTFDLITRPITIEDGVWIGARSVVCPGVHCKSHSVLTVGSIATKDLEEYSIYQGNPAVKVKQREIMNAFSGNS